ncbi:MAG: hypothetical protein ACI8ZN_002083 [Bacteroidia bacterium]|jgi:hypothetical protein
MKKAKLLIMNKFRSFIVVLLVLQISACTDDSKNQSKVNLLQLDDFIIRSIQKGSDNAVICTGFYEKLDDFVVLEYNEDLNFQRKTQLNGLAKFNGSVKLLSLQENGYLISCFISSDVPQRLMLYKTDPDFNITKEVQVSSWNNAESKTNVRQLIELKNGDILMAFDTMGISPKFSGFVFQRFDKDLETLFRYADNIMPNTGGFSPRIVELEDESLFYVIATSHADIGGPFKSIRSGRLSKAGASLFSNFTSKQEPLLAPVGLSLMNNKLVYEVLINQEVLHFMTFDIETGGILLDQEMSYNEVNHFNQYGAFVNQYPFTLLVAQTIGEANSFSSHGTQSQGHVLYSKATSSLFMSTVNDQLIPSVAFNVQLPAFDQVKSYRQLYQNDGNVLVAVSYDYLGESYFNLQKLDLNGKVVE